MKKIFILTVASILLIFTWFSARELLQSDLVISSQESIPTGTPVVKRQQMVNNTFITYLNDKSSETEVTYETLGVYNDSLITNEQTPKQWKLYWESTQLEITLNSEESSPFGSDVQPESNTLVSQLSENPIHRIKVDENFYFYTDKFFNDSCGQKFCSSGLVNTKGENDFSIFCTINNDGLGDLEFCDQIVINLREKID